MALSIIGLVNITVVLNSGLVMPCLPMSTGMLQPQNYTSGLLQILLFVPTLEPYILTFLREASKSRAASFMNFWA